MQKSLKQINIKYLPNEDRLLLKARTSNEDELRIWLTRRYTSLLINVLVQQMNKAGGMLELASNKSTLAQFKNGAFQQNYDPPAEQTFPLGESGIVGFRISASTNADARISLRLLPEKGEGLNLNLDKSLLFMFYNLLEQALLKAEWNLQLPQSHKDLVH
jgi:hypothetical protein